MSASDWMLISASTSASGMFGVMTSASWRRSSFRVSIASSEMRRAPLVATMTGSTTMFFASYCWSFSAMVVIRSEFETMPIFTASGKMSVKISSSCSARKSGELSWMAVTPVVFCAVRAVMALIAKTPFMVIVLMSA